jgi:hypothetical protein
LVTVAVYGGQGSTFKNWVERFRLRGRAGRVALNLPFLGQPPYHVIVESQAISGRFGSRVELPVPCPGTGDSVKGCLRGYKPAAHSYPMPKPVLPLRGVDRSALEASFAQVLADEARPPIVKAVPGASRCISLRVCEVAYADPAFPGSPYRVRYAIAGQQLSGCWLGLRGRILDPRPYDDASYGRLFLAGCTSWLD